MNKQLTFLLSLTFLISFSGSVYGDEYNEALNKWKLAAEQGKVKAQYNLGVMYAKGIGVPKDYALAHMWFNLSGSNGHKNGMKNRGIVEKIMSPSQIEKAQEMARNWKPKK